MTAPATQTRRDAAAPSESLPPWCRCAVRLLGDIGPAVAPLLETLPQHGFPPADVFAVRLALEEALVNAVKHGNGGDPGKSANFAYRVGDDGLCVEIEDEGPGFLPEHAPDPFAPENLERDGGRGLFLMRHYMTWVAYNAAGNRVTLFKRRSPCCD